MLIGRAFAVNLVAATILATMLASCGGGGAPKRVFVSGYVSAAVTTPATKLHDIALPHASVFLYLSSAPANPVASTLSDLSGRFKLKADKPGVYDLCVELKGFPRTCQRHLTLAKTSTTISPFRMARTHGDTRDRATLFGKTTLADGSIPRGFAPMLKVNAFVKYQVKSAAGIEFEGYLNEFGEYIAPSVPTSEDFTIELAIDNAKRTILVRKETQLAPNADHEFNIYLKDHPPKINLVSAAIAGKPVETVALNGVVTLTATANDLDGDQLAYRWLLPDGATDGVLAGPNASNKVQWTVPGKKGSYSAIVLVSDGRGGYATSSATVNVGDTRVTFSGVVVDVAGNPIDQAQVDINGRLLNTNADGRFTLKVPVDDRYVMNLRKPGVDSPGATGYGTGSYVYARAI
ncbi:MAG TPA: hypothetical protein VNH64_12910, partial [Parvularculaceae bacterium]|nr:hypothetical protein [Parvularculaceae bacterium]